MSIASSYNEAFDESGNLRAAYRAFHTRTGQNALAPSVRVAAELTNAPLKDRYSILPIPLVLEEREYRDVIAAGVRQRALALQALFFDLVRGNSSGFGNTSLPKQLFSLILEKEHIAMDELAAWWDGKTREAVRFTYAPDLVRDADGRWLILEDNIGCVGGVVDAGLVLERFLESTGTRLHFSVNNGSSFARAVCEFLARVGLAPASAEAVALLGQECATHDPEATRKRHVLEALGLRVLDGLQPDLRLHDVRAIVNFSSSLQTHAWRLADDLFGRCQVPLMNAPGVAVLGNKALLPFMDDIVAFYAGGEPILKAAESRLCDDLPAPGAEWVVKRSNGAQGRDVFFLDAMNDAEWRQLDATLHTWGPSGSILQRRVSASILSSSADTTSCRFQVELRPFAFVIGDAQCVVGEQVSGRAFTNTDGQRVGNMSRGASYLPVVREPTAPVTSTS